MKKVEKFAALAVVFVFGIALIVGCSALRKPAPQNPPKAQETAPAAPSSEPMPTNPEEVQRMAANLANIAKKVPGVTDATVVIAGTTAYVGIDQKAGVEDSETSKVKKAVSDEIKKAEPRLTAVYVSSDPDIVTRLREIASGIAQGQPVSAFDFELAEIAKRLSPTSR